MGLERENNPAHVCRGAWGCLLGTRRESFQKSLQDSANPGKRGSTSLPEIEESKLTTMASHGV
jgi:hypothetical protein